MTIARYSRKRKRPHDVFDILHATRIDGRPDIACWISECPPPVTSQTHKHRRALADISHTHNPQYHKPSIMSSTLRKQRKADDEENQATRSRTRNAARLGSALSLRSTVNSIAEDENPILVTEDASVVSAFDTISEAPSFHPPTTVSSKTSRSSTRTRSSSPKKRVVTKREDLAYLSPRIEFKAMRQAENLGITLSGSVQALWERCEARRSAPPFASSLIPFTATDTELINNTLIDAFDMAEKWRSTNTTESHWISVVVGPILHLLRASVEISLPELCPYSSEPDLFKDLDKKIDYAVGLDISRHALLML
ncbi:hypothetical protein V2W45_1337572 [Cenococcum geophilum]